MKMYELSTEKNTQCENCELSVIGGKMKTSLGDSSSGSSEELLRRGEEKSVLFMILVKGCTQAGTHVG